MRQQCSGPLLSYDLAMALMSAFHPLRTLAPADMMSAGFNRGCVANNLTPNTPSMRPLNSEEARASFPALADQA